MAFIRTKRNSGHDYHYLVESYRPGPGKTPRQRIVEYIGNDDALRALAMAGIQARDGGTPAGATFRAYEHGSVAALWKAADLLGIESIIDDELPKKTVKGMGRGRVLTLAMLHRACDPGSKSAFAPWAASTSLPYHLRFDAPDLDGQAFWEAMDGIDEDGVRRVRERVVARLLELFPGALDTMHLDHANYHTWIDTANERCVICRRGHNKQKRNDLRQFGLAMLTAAALRLPLVWELYEGNRNDKSEFPDFVEAVAKSPVVRDRPDATVVFDGGGNSEEALSSLPFHFVCGHSVEGMKDLYDIDIDEYETVDIGEGRERLAHRVDGLEFSGAKGTGVLTFSQGLYDGQTRDVERMEAKLAKKVSELQKRLDNPRSTLFSRLRAARRESEDRRREAESYNGQLEADKAEGRRKRCRPRAMPPEFDEAEAMGEIVSAAAFKEARKLRPYWGVEVAKATGEDGAPSWKVTATRDDEARDAHFRRSFGKKLTVTDRTEWETEEILAAYADQECVENLFRGTKGTDHFSVRPQFHWTDDKIRVHVLICLTSLVLAEVVRAHLAAAGVTVSREAMLDTLSTVHDGWVRVGDRKAVRAVEELDGRKRTMWEAVVAMPGRMPGAR